MATQQGQEGGGKSGQSQGGRGFASMDEEKQREIASKGGHAAHEQGTAHEFDSEEARKAGQKGGEAVSQDTQHMSEIGQKGGEARAAQMHQQSSGSSSAASKKEEEEDQSADQGQQSKRGGTPEQHSKSGRQSHKNQ